MDVKNIYMSVLVHALNMGFKDELLLCLPKGITSVGFSLTSEIDGGGHNI
jgi:hypothetical protein